VNKERIVAGGYFEIDKGIPVPEKPTSYKNGRDKYRKYSRYPFRFMQIGDSFFTRNKWVNTAHYKFSKSNPEFVFTQRAVDNGVRVWRVKKRP
jgi:hypothetical protein